MFEQPSPEHLWLQKLVGQWAIEMECVMGPDQPPSTSTSTEVTRALGGLWVLGEGTMADGESTHTSVMTLGYDPKVGSFVGSFVTSCMTHFWNYKGSVDPTGKVLVLDAEGPSFSGDGSLAKYQDCIEIVDDDHRVLSSRVLQPDGTWVTFMTARYRRVPVASPNA